MIEHEVPAPDVVFVLGPTSVATVRTLSQASAFSLLSRHFQALSTP
jgi:hypothetical protein